MPTRVELRPEEITIAVTVYSRREFVLEAIQSALDQTVPVKVIVVEDCGPDAGLREMIVGHFGNRITYFRNSKNRGLFDNWNACMEYCTTSLFTGDWDFWFRMALRGGLAQSATEVSVVRSHYGVDRGTSRVE